MNNGRRVELDVTYNNAPFAGQVGAEIESLTYVDNAADDSDSIDITLDAQDSKWLHGWLPEEGATLRPRIIGRDWNGPGDTHVMECGLFKYKKVKKNKSASRAPAGESIEQRPEEIDEREEFGHWEGDTVYSGRGKRKTTRALLTLTERKTRKEIIIAIPNRKAETVVKALDALERKLGARRFRAIFKSITFDNGTEFAAAEELERSCVNKRLPRTKVYFCHPYSSWERGTNENTNGMIRRRFPKGTNFAAVTNAQIAQAENWINNYPRKILGYKSSEIVFRECLRELGIAA